MADCHLGGWRHPKMRELSFKYFEEAISRSIKKNVDFILISGDLFNTSLPGVDILKATVKKLKELRNNGIPVYIIAGSHDYSPSGKTMLDVLEEAELVKNVFVGKVVDGKLRLDFTIDEKTGAKITGMLGKRGMLERTYYEDLDKEFLEKEEGIKIFMFHTALTELKPKSLEKMSSSPVSLLPVGFEYYAGGHVHIVENKTMLGYKNVVYPGPTFPNTFYELEELGRGGFFIYDEGNVNFEEINLCVVKNLKFVVDGKIPEEVTQNIMDEIEGKTFFNNIILIRIAGILSSGKVSDIDFNRIYHNLYERNAYFIMRNTVKLSSKDFEEMVVKEGPQQDIEKDIIDDHIGQIDVKNWDKEKELDMINKMMTLLNSSKQDGEKVYEYEDRIVKDLGKLLDVDV